MRTPAVVLDITADSVRTIPGLGSAGEGARCAPPNLVDAALDWIDDPVGLLDERPVAVAELWRSLMLALVDQPCDSILLVYPAQWPRHRIERVTAAANAMADHVEAVSRDRWHGIGFVDAGVCGADEPSADEPRERQLEDGPSGRPRRLRMTALLAAVAGVALGGIALASRSGPVEQDASLATVVEGRMAVHVPRHWIVERVTSGPGSRRLQVSSPKDPQVAVHLTSAYAPETTLAQAAEVLSRAIAHEPPGVFVDVHPLDDVGGRAAVTYREVRPGRTIAWSVVLAGATRVSVGCQSPPGREREVRAACEQAVRSAREK